MKCYRFDNKEEFYFLADIEGFIFEDGNENQVLKTYSHNHAIHEIGPIIKEPGAYQDEIELVAPIFDPGYHVNFLGEDIDSWEPYRIKYCDHPHVIFAGHTAEKEPVEPVEVVEVVEHPMLEEKKS